MWPQSPLLDLPLVLLIPFSFATFSAFLFHSFHWALSLTPPPHIQNISLFVPPYVSQPQIPLTCLCLALYLFLRSPDSSVHPTHLSSSLPSPFLFFAFIPVRPPSAAPLLVPPLPLRYWSVFINRCTLPLRSDHHSPHMTHWQDVEWLPG